MRIPALPIQTAKIDNVFMSTHIHVLKINGTLEAAGIIKYVKLSGIPSQGRKLKSCFVQISK